MKKFLLSLVALLGVMNVNAQDIKFVMDEVEVRQGGSVAVPINIENTIDCYAWEGIIGVEGVNVLNGDVKFSNYERGARVQNIAYTKVTFDEETGEEIGREDRTDGAFDIPYEPQKQEDGTYAWIITGYNTGAFAMKDNSGAVAYITFTVPETVEVGTTFTGYIKDIHFGNAEGEDVPQDDITFTIKVVENVITLADNSTTAPEALTGVNVKVLREIKAGNWSTICLPFAMTEAQVKGAFGEEAQLADFNGTDLTYDDEKLIMAINVKFTSATSIEANHPYILKATKDITYEDGFTVKNVNIKPVTTPQVGKDLQYDENEDEDVPTSFFYGVYVPTTLDKATYLFLSDNNFYYSNRETQLKGFRGYFKLQKVIAAKYKNISSSTGVKMFIDNVPTSISDIDFVTAPEGVFTIDGKKMNNDVTKLPKGVYIIDGKKVAIK